MRQRDDFEPSGPTYTLENEELNRQLDELLEELKPYPHLELLREVFVTGVKLAWEDCSRGDLKILRASMKELRYAFKLFASYRSSPKLSLFGSSRCLPEDAEFQTALEFSRKMAEAGYMVITGAGPGVMAAGNLGVGKEMSFGLNIQLPFEQYANETIAGDKKLINFRYFFTRKLFFIKESDAIVLMPGGFGTLDEGFETLTLLQTGKDEPTPVVMLDCPGGTYWKDWRRFLERQLLSRGYISEEDQSLFFITDDTDKARAEILTFYRRYHSSRYVEGRKKLVLRLKEPVGQDLVDRLNEKFTDILLGSPIEICQPFPEEADEPELLGLSRLVLSFNQHHFGRLRQLIDVINSG